jgi:hypothetical protein
MRPSYFKQSLGRTIAKEELHDPRRVQCDFVKMSREVQIPGEARTQDVRFGFRAW